MAGVLREAAERCRATSHANSPGADALRRELGDSLAGPVADLLNTIAALDQIGQSTMRSRNHAIRAGRDLAAAILAIVGEAEDSHGH